MDGRTARLVWMDMCRCDVTPQRSVSLCSRRFPTFSISALTEKIWKKGFLWVLLWSYFATEGILTLQKGSHVLKFHYGAGFFPGSRGSNSFLPLWHCQKIEGVDLRRIICRKRRRRRTLSDLSAPLGGNELLRDPFPVFPHTGKKNPSKEKRIKDKDPGALVASICLRLSSKID